MKVARTHWKCVLARYLSLAVLVSLMTPLAAFGQVSFTAPDGSTTPVAHCNDYFSYEWNTPLDMSGPDNGPLNYIPGNEVRQIDAYSYSNGILSFTTSGPSATMTLVESLPLDPATGKVGALPIGGRYGENHPIIPSTYHNLVVRMYASIDTTAQILWGSATVGRAISIFNVKKGWHTYKIDMNSVSASTISGSNTGWNSGTWDELTLLPTNSAGVLINVDFIQLLGDAGCGTGTISFSAAAQGDDDRYVVAIDTDSNPDNGFELSVTGAAGGPISKSIGGNSSDFPIAYLNPGSHTVYGAMSSDWATLNMLDPWDFADSGDIQSNAVFGITSTSVSGGNFTGTVTSADPSFYVNLRGLSIDAATFQNVSIGISYSFPGGVTSNSVDFLFFDTNNQYLGLRRFSGSTFNGYQNYDLTLSPADSWSGQIGAIRIDPTNGSEAIGTVFSIDYISIRHSGIVRTLGWPTVVAAGSTLEVNNPSVSFIQPDEQGGRDYAQNVLGNSWNMNEPSDITRVINSSAAANFPNNGLTDELGNVIIGDFFRAENILGNDDPQCPLLSEISADKRVNTVEYMNLCFRAWNKTGGAGYNSVARVIWHNPGISDTRESYKDGDDIILYRGAHDYCLDLSKDSNTRTEPLQPTGSPNPWTAVTAQYGTGVDVLRVDLNEVAEEPYWSVLDYVHLRSDHEANSQYAIVVKAPLDQTVDLYYKPAAGGSETAIGTLAAGRNTNVYKWNTSNVTPGKYYVVGRNSDNGNSFVQQAPGRVDISHSRDQDTTAPILECERPGNGYVFDSTYEIAGYALDETRLATVDLFVDGTFIKSIVPNMFHLAARDAYATYAESNNPGFQQFIDGTGLSYGSHTVVLKAIDTAGNETSCSNSVTRQVGANPSPLVYPDNNATPVEMPIYVTPPVANPKVTVKIGAKSKVSYTITGTESCATVSLIAGSNNQLSNAVTLLTTAGSSSTIASSVNVPTFQKPKKSKDDGVLHFLARCDTGELSNKPSLNTKKTKNKKKLTSEKKLLGYLRKHTAVGQ